MRATAIAILLGGASACSKPAAPPPQKSAADSAQASTADVARAAETNEWNRGEVIKRLNEAGLVVTDIGRPVDHANLTQSGTLIGVSGSSLEVYIYPTAADRKRDAVRLDTATRIPVTADRQRFIESGNLIAIHITPRDALAERVENVLTARHMDAP